MHLYSDFLGKSMTHSLPPLQLKAKLALTWPKTSWRLHLTQELWEEKFGFAVHGWTRLQDHGAAPLPGQQQRPFSSDSAFTHEKDAEYFLDISYLLTKPEYSVPSWCVSTHTDVLGWADFPGYYWNYFLPRVYLWDGSLGGHVSFPAGIRFCISTLLVRAQSLRRVVLFCSFRLLTLM